MGGGIKRKFKLYVASLFVTVCLASEQQEPPCGGDVLQKSCTEHTTEEECAGKISQLADGIGGKCSWIDSNCLTATLCASSGPSGSPFSSDPSIIFHLTFDDTLEDSKNRIAIESQGGDACAYVEGIHGKAIDWSQCPGAKAHLIGKGKASAAGSTEAWTHAWWFMPKADSSNKKRQDFLYPSPQPFDWDLGSPTSAHFTYNRDSQALSPYHSGTHTKKASWTKDTWYHIAVVRNGNSHKIYVDGKLDNEGTKGPSGKTMSDFKLGNWQDTANYILDEFVAFKRAFTAEEITTLAMRG